ncbi:MAG: hypothetical protein OEZ02_02705 [Anaerolineae bacterium]|nr:hypothetical protein [Anaerolineae bacterium]
MTNNSASYAKGDWIVHLYYGVGQIKGIEKKAIGGEKTEYFKVSTGSSTFWVPVKDPDTTRIRPVASKQKMRNAIKVFKSAPEPLSQDHNERKRQIGEVMADLSLIATAELIRDLCVRKVEHKLNPSEEKALLQLSENLTREWSVSMEIEIEKAQTKYQDIIQELQASVS